MAVLQDEELERVKKFYADILSSLYSQSVAFTNIISAAGYVGAFTLWNFIKADLNKTASNWVAVLLGISLAVFVAWNVFNMIWLASQRLRYGAQMKGLAGDGAIKRWGELIRETEERTHSLYLPLWVTVVIVTVTTAMIALGILIVNCGINILSESV